MSAELSPALLAALDGTDLGDKVGLTLLLLSSDADGSPHAAFLSVGEVIAPSPTQVALALHAGSRTAANLGGTGRAAILGVCEGKAQIVRLRCGRAEPVEIAGRELLCFRAEVTAVEPHDAPYATDLTGISFGLRDPEATVARWQETVAALRALPQPA